MTLTGIVLAGGRSTRFGADKLAEPLDGEPLLAAAIEALLPLADAVIVAGPGLPDGFEAGDVTVVLARDREPFDGPLVAVANVLETAVGDPGIAIVVAGDMPRLVPAVLLQMVEVLRRDATAGAVYLGRQEAAIGTDRSDPLPRQALPLAVRVQPASRAARDAVEAGHRSLQALLDRITAIELPAAVWLALDPAATTLLDVDTPADLDRLRRS